jgi:hypothetical protein
MTYIVARPDDRWEVRESRTTPKGPRSRTLATFRRLTPEVVEHAASRSRGVLTAAQLRDLATRAGAPVEESAADAAAATLLGELERGRPPSAARRRMLLAALANAREPASDAELAVAPWLAASAEERGEALRDLLDLTDVLPATTRPQTVRFPRLESRRR